jgi:MFS family permease
VIVPAAAMLLDSPVQVAVVTASSTLPWLLLGLPAGALVDRARRLRVMVVADLLRALALVGFTIGSGLHQVGFVALVVLALIMGVGEVAFDLASFAVLPSIVGGAALERANGRLFAVQIGCRDIVGHVAGGVLIGLSQVWPFIVDGALFVASAALLSQVADPPVPPRQRRRLLDEVREGVSYLFRDRVLRVLALAAGVVNSVHLGQIAVLPLFALHRLHLPVSSYGGLLAMSSIGGIAGASLAERATRRFHPNRILVAGLTLLALQSLAIGSFPTTVVAFAGFFMAGAGMMAWNVVAVSIRQACVPSTLLGRVGSVYRLISWGTMPIGGVAFGVLATRYGPPLRSPSEA